MKLPQSTFTFILKLNLCLLFSTGMCTWSYLVADDVFFMFTHDDQRYWPACQTCKTNKSLHVFRGPTCRVCNRPVCACILIILLNDTDFLFWTYYRWLVNKPTVLSAFGERSLVLSIVVTNRLEGSGQRMTKVVCCVWTLMIKSAHIS